jgi:hypothetical protein
VTGTVSLKTFFVLICIFDLNNIGKKFFSLNAAGGEVTAPTKGASHKYEKNVAKIYSATGQSCKRFYDRNLQL